MVWLVHCVAWRRHTSSALRKRPSFCPRESAFSRAVSGRSRADSRLCGLLWVKVISTSILRQIYSALQVVARARAFVQERVLFACWAGPFTCRFMVVWASMGATVPV
eukprot:14410150-Alexandrium_andersonii.AAC.1